MNSDTSAEADETPDEEPEPDEATAEEEPAEVSTKGRPTAFVLLTCGFLACMCCVGGVFAGGSVAWMRMSNLDAALDKVGAPSAWQTTESSATPWGAEATMTGPGSSIGDWLTDLGVPVDDEETAECVDDPDGCNEELTVDGFDVVIHYGRDGAETKATVQID